MRSDELRNVRRQRLRQLIAEFKTVAEVARRSGVSEKYLSQVLNEVVQQRGKNPRGLGDESAAKLEDGLGKPRGWLDTPSLRKEFTARSGSAARPKGRWTSESSLWCVHGMALERRPTSFGSNSRPF